ncbi:MAG: hypothetical protein ABIP94_11790, partial [Planctomycetota bacterium]
ALAYYETIFDSELLGSEVDAIIELPAGRLRLDARGTDFVPNGLHFVVPDLAVLHDRLRERGCVAEGDALAVRIDGGSDFSATDQDGNRLTFVAAACAR